MRTSLKIGLGIALIALICGGALWWNFLPASAQAAGTAQTQATAQPTAQARGNRQNPRERAAMMLVKVTADATSQKPSDVLAQLRQGQSLAEIAAAHGSSGDKIIQAATDKIKARLDKAVTSGKLTQDQANQRLTKLTAKLTQAVNDKQLGTKIERAARKGGAQALIATTVSLTGQTREQVLADLKSGKSLADIAAAHGSSGDKIVQALLDKAKTRLDQAVANGKLTQDQANQRLSKLHDALTAAVARPGLKGKHKAT